MMTKRLLGRANRFVYPLWAKGSLQGRESAEQNAQHLFEYLLQSPIEVLDITPAPGLWGHLLRRYPNKLQVAIVVPAHLIGLAGDATRSAYNIQSHLIETLCAIGREYADYYFLSLPESLTEAQISGALEALEIARQEGQVRVSGLACYGDPLHTLAIWRTHDAFEVILLPAQEAHLQVLLPEARTRRVGVIVEVSHPITFEQAESLQEHYHGDALLGEIRF